MRVCVPITADGQVDPRWGRADRVALAEVARRDPRLAGVHGRLGNAARPGDGGCPSRPGGAVPPGQPDSGDRCPPRWPGHAAHAGLDGDRGRHRSGRGRPQRGAGGGVTKHGVSPQRNADPGCQRWRHPRMPLRATWEGSPTVGHGSGPTPDRGAGPESTWNLGQPRQRPQAGEQAHRQAH